jgi:hypothetical protein
MQTGASFHSGATLIRPGSVDAARIGSVLAWQHIDSSARPLSPWQG